MAADGTRTAALGVVQVVFLAAFSVLIGAQLALMSILDVERAEEAARTVAESEFAADLVDDAVRSAVVPIAGESVGSQIATIASSDPRVADVIERGLTDAHRSIVEPDAVVVTGSSEVEAVLGDVIDEAEVQTGVDLSGLRSRLDAPQVDPRFVPNAGARPIAEQARAVAGIAALVSAAIVLIVHPRRGRALAALGTRAAIVCGTWAVVLLVVGWLIGTVADTLFGELLAALWSSAAPSMLLLVIAGTVLGVGFAVGGVSIDGMAHPSGERR